LFDGLLVDELAAGGVLLEVFVVEAAGGLAGEDAGGEVEPADVSFFSPAAAGALSPSEGGFSLLE
jgi:hypothetical protein